MTAVKKPAVKRVAKPAARPAARAAAKPAARAAAKPALVTSPVDAVVAASKESVESAVKAGAEAATKNYEKVVSLTKEQVDVAAKAGVDAFKNYGEFAAYGQAGMDAMVKSGVVLAKGLQDLNKVWFDMAQASMEMNVANAKALFSCKDPAEALKLQTEMARAGYDRLMADGQKVTDLSVKLATEVSAPFVGQFNKAVETMSKPFAA
ncbi:MAG: phasin family protein [Hyphomicrobiales bacterium]|nr:phasin family protein [Hyphomicrobiales bacterium]MCP5374287.1 phasin family protein [Hyphomicrobiales bacterium]